jgi:hypothetical protein
MKVVQGLLLTLGAAAAALVFTAGPASANGPDVNTGPNVGILNGNVVQFPVSFPVNVCGNSGALVGLAITSTSCTNRY